MPPTVQTHHSVVCQPQTRGTLLLVERLKKLRLLILTNLYIVLSIYWTQMCTTFKILIIN